MRFIEALIELDKNLLLWINHFSGNPVLDAVMVSLSAKWIWVPFYLILFYGIYRSYSVPNVLWILLAAGCMVVLTDQVSVHLFKDVFQRLRPCHNEELKNAVNLVSGRCGGMYGFISSHASNVFALASFCSFLLARFRLFGIFIFIWASGVSVSRVYLGVHYPSDVFVGALFGVVVGLSVVSITLKTVSK